ncbi:MAG: hypothetical protein ABJZ55_05760 [Fuerstiella sp.]
MMNYSIASFLTLAMLFAVGLEARSTKSGGDNFGTIVLKVVDADSGEPIPNVTFAISNSLAEVWEEPVGVSDANGRVQLDSKLRRGYFYSIYPVPDSYRVSGMDAVPAAIELGKTVEHCFHLRQKTSKATVPDIVGNADLHPSDDGFTTKTMPGFAGQSVQIHLKRTAAENLYRNGNRLRAAIDDELSYFKKAEGEKAGNIAEIRDVKIVPTHAPGGGWTVWCRTDGCIKFKQDGFKVEFDAKLERWELVIPDYLHPDF